MIKSLKLIRSRRTSLIKRTSSKKPSMSNLRGLRLIKIKPMMKSKTSKRLSMSLISPRPRSPRFSTTLPRKSRSWRVNRISSRERLTILMTSAIRSVI